MVPVLITLLSLSATAPLQPEKPAPPGWASLDPGLIGSVRPLLVEHPELVAAPVAQTTLPDKLGRILGIAGDAGRAFLLATDEEDEHFVVTRVSLPDGAASKLCSFDVEAPDRLQLTLTSDGVSLLVLRPDHRGITVLATKDGTRRELECMEGARIPSFVLGQDGAVLAGGKGLLQRWDLATLVRTEVKVEAIAAFISPLAAGADGRAIVLVFPTEARQPAIAAIELGTGKMLAKRDVDMDVFPIASRDASRICLLPGHPVPEAVVLLDPATLKDTSRQRLQPRLGLVSARLTASGTLLLTENMVQPLIARDLVRDRWAAVMCPELGGCVCMEVNADEKLVTAVTGDWKNGELSPAKISVYRLPDPPAAAPPP